MAQSVSSNRREPSIYGLHWCEIPAHQEVYEVFDQNPCRRPSTSDMRAAVGRRSRPEDVPSMEWLGVTISLLFACMFFF